MTIEEIARPSEVMVVAAGQTLADRLGTEVPFALVFGGQGADWLTSLRELCDEGGARLGLERLVADASRLLEPIAHEIAPLRPWGFDPLAWLGDEDEDDDEHAAASRPPSAALVGVAVSCPGSLLTQIAVMRLLADEGLDLGRAVALAGHSQGVLGACAAAEAGRRDVELMALAQIFGAAGSLIGRRRGLVTDGRRSPMLAVGNVDPEQLQLVIDELFDQDPPRISVRNGRRRVVLSGRPDQLDRIRRRCDELTERSQAEREAKRTGGAVFRPVWEEVGAEVGFHHPGLADTVGVAVAWARACGIELDADSVSRALPVGPGAPVEALARAVYIDAVDWVATIRRVESSEPAWLLDIGPSDLLTRMTRGVMRGNGRGVLAAGTPEGRRSLFSAGAEPARERPWSDWAPRAVELPDGSRSLDTAFTRLTGCSPVLLAGMTPTTVDPAIVAAAANAGHWAELAGGGQVTEAILEDNLARLADLLEPGRTAAFNALFLDPYLWKLQIGGKRLVPRARANGAPIDAVVVSAGIPELDDAVELVHDLIASGIEHVAFKPGTVAQIRQVIRIGKAVGDQRLIVHIEGGRAGGHHSWEDLDDLLLETYADLRGAGNLIICVGGGIGTPERGVDYLTGRWSVRHGARPMPVDGILVGTAAMACAEATTSPQVKELLVATPGSDRWIGAGVATAGMTSGRSQLGADIHEIDNAAGRCGRLLDQVAGDADAVAERRDEIIEALARTAKPYFGDLDTITYRDWLLRYVELAATPIDSGEPEARWLDVTWRDRFVAMLQRTEARLHPADRGRVPTLFADPSAADRPEAAVAAVLSVHPDAATTLLHPADVGFFIEQCKTLGKPVNFVPVIDADVRRWWRSDSLWQAHDPRYDSDAVVVIPGPVSVAGIDRVDEPVADLLGRFHDAAIDAVLAAQPVGLVASPRRRADEHVPGRDARPMPAGAVADALAAPLAMWAGRLTANPVHRLGAPSDWLIEAPDLASHPHSGATLRQLGNGSAPSLVEFEVPTGSSAVRIRLDVSDCHTNRVPRVHLDDAVDAMQGLLHSLVGAGGLPPVDRGAASSTTAWSPERLADHSGVTAATMSADLLTVAHVPDAYLVAAWPAVFAVLGSARCADGTPVVEGLLDLVHLDHHVAVPSGPAHDPLIGSAGSPGAIRCDATVESVTDTDVGRVVEIHATLLGDKGVDIATLVERFAIRGRAGSTELTAPMPVAPTSAGDGVERRRRRSVSISAPARLDAFAEVSGDHNPIHVSQAAADLAGLGGPIVHGMWLSAAAQHVAAAGDDDTPAAPVLGWTARFLAPVRPGETLEIRVERIGVVAGGEVREVSCRVDGELVMVASARCRAPRTVYAFPGQGIQRVGMGLDAIDRSRAARRVWDRADRHTRERLGFSILAVVRDNPTSVYADGELHRHPDGVLFLTQFTQVAMAAVAMAQVAELREAGVFLDESLCCGHSVGEYNALAAITGVLPLESVLEVVFQRGMAMHHLVPRDADGRSNYRLAAIRPSEAGIADDAVNGVVAAVAERTGEFLQIVNHNLRGAQYVVAGTVAGLDELEREMDRRREATGGKRAFIVVPGIDVPFHSVVLRDGVDEFRVRLESLIPAEVDPTMLVGRYIPNLVPRLFSLERDFVREIADLVPSEPLGAVLDDWDSWSQRPVALCRVLLIELLAWQFASPVRWIETQDLLFERVDHGGLGVERFVEVGLASSPTLANLARSTVARSAHLGVRPQILNVEADRAAVFLTDADPAELDEAETVDEPAARPAVDAAPRPPVAQSAPAGDVADLSYTASDATLLLLALWTKLRPEQVSPIDSIESLCDGVSSRRNQILVDLGAELNLGAIDGAAEADVADLRVRVSQLARTYRPFGPVLRDALDDQLRRVLGPSGKRRPAIAERVTSTWRLGPGWVEHVTAEIAAGSREGASVRGGPLGGLVEQAPTDGRGFEALVDAAVASVAARHGVVVALETAAAGTAVDSAALDELDERIAGRDGVLAEAARQLLDRLGHLDVAHEPVADRSAAELADLVSSELGPDWARLVAPAFDGNRAVLLDDRFASAREDLVDLWLAGQDGDTAELDRIEASLARVDDDIVAEQARWWAARAASAGAGDLAERYERAAATSRDGALPFANDVAVVCGGSPGSIAAAVIGQLLEGGATVVATTSRLDRERLAHFRRLYRERAASGAALWVVPANLASFGDVDELVDWVGSQQTISIGPVSTVVKEAMTPTLLFPFAAPTVLGDLTGAGPRAELEMRVLLWSVERLIGRLGAVGRDRHVGASLHVVLPGSPNRGRFGGDGAYGESKAALDAVVARWRAERSWAERVTLVHAVIGWVRGTGLMGRNDPLVDAVEAAGVTTWSTEAMAAELLALCGPAQRRAAATAPVEVDLTGGLADVDVDLAALARQADDAGADRADGDAGADHAEDDEGEVSSPTIAALSSPPADTDLRRMPDWAPVDVALEDLVVIVGVGEIGPCGSSRTRYEMEVDDELSAGGVAELAWLCGLIVWEAEPQPGWYDVATGERVPESELVEDYHDEVVSRCGIRPFVDDGPIVDGTAPLLASVFLDRDLSFVVSGETEARSFADADPDRTAVVHDEVSGEWRVIRRAGTEIRVPRRHELSRTVGAQLPDGFDPTRYGIPADLAASIDRLAAWNLVATVDAFVSAGFDPAELMRWVHPTEVANTQGTGIGGISSVRSMYVDSLLGTPHANDVLQEALPNVIAAHVAQSYVGGYGAMVHPVAACATAGISVEAAVDKIRLGRARLVVAGGFDDLGAEGIAGFGDMSATAETAAMAAKGIEPRYMSRANDRRRGGFVEGQGGGTVLLARGDLALAMGLPVYGVVAYASSFGDGVHTSIPAPGLGALAAGRGGPKSELARSLAALRVEPDDIAVISKHDTSTQANDPNESELHELLAVALGRSPGAPLFVVSQKSLTGHAKGGAAAFQLAGLCQMLAGGTIPANRSLDCVDPVLAAHPHLVWPRSTIRFGDTFDLRAGLLTSLGFGHVSALIAVVHPAAFLAALDESQRDDYLQRSRARSLAGRRRIVQAMCGGAPLYHRPPDRRIGADADGPGRGRRTEVAMLLDSEVRLGADGVYGVPGRDR